MFIAKQTILHLANASGIPAVPTEIDLGGADAPMLLTQLERAWSAPMPGRCDAMLAGLRLHIPAPAVHGHGVVVLPGGATALRAGLEGVLVCDPLAVVTLHAAPAAALRSRLAAKFGVLTIMHTGDGLTLENGVPGTLPTQACSIVPDAAALGDLAPAARLWRGRMLVQWHVGGAAVWRMVQAPGLLALAASVAGRTIPRSGVACPTDVWDATCDAARIERLSPGLFERTCDLLIDEVSDALRLALARRAVSGTDSLVARLSEAVRLLPMQFGAQRAQAVGGPLLNHWPEAADALARAGDLVMIGIEAGVDGQDGVPALRAVLDGEGLFFAEQPAIGGPMALGAASVQRLSRQLDQGSRYGVLLAAPVTAADLYGMAADLARQTGGRVITAAPGWGFYHRIDARDDTEAGNAGWFGMGAGLDELEWL